MSKRLFVVEVSAHWFDELVVYAEDEAAARRIAESEASPGFDESPVDIGGIGIVEKDEDLPESYKRTDYPLGEGDNSIGEIMHPEPPESDPTEPPQEYHCHCGDRSWLKVQGWRVMQDFPGMEPYHWFIHRSVNRVDGQYTQDKTWTISEATTGMTCGGIRHCPTRAQAQDDFRAYFAAHPEHITRTETVTNVKGTENESPGYPREPKRRAVPALHLADFYRPMR